MLLAVEEAATRVTLSRDYTAAETQQAAPATPAADPINDPERDLDVPAFMRRIQF